MSSFYSQFPSSIPLCIVPSLMSLQSNIHTINFLICKMGIVVWLHRAVGTIKWDCKIKCLDQALAHGTNLKTVTKETIQEQINPFHLSITTMFWVFTTLNLVLPFSGGGNSLTRDGLFITVSLTSITTHWLVQNTFSRINGVTEFNIDAHFFFQLESYHQVPINASPKT